MAELLQPKSQRRESEAEVTHLALRTTLRSKLRAHPGANSKQGHLQANGYADYTKDVRPKPGAAPHMPKQHGCWRRPNVAEADLCEARALTNLENAEVE